MNVCICACLHMCMRACMCVCICTCVSVCQCRCIFMCACVRVSKAACVHIHACVIVHSCSYMVMHVCMLKCVQICRSACVCPSCFKGGGFESGLLLQALIILTDLEPPAHLAILHCMNSLEDSLVHWLCCLPSFCGRIYGVQVSLLWHRLVSCIDWCVAVSLHICS